MRDIGGLKNTQRWVLVLFGSTGAQASLGDLRCPRQSLEGIIYIIGILHGGNWSPLFQKQFINLSYAFILLKYLVSSVSEAGSPVSLPRAR